MEEFGQYPHDLTGFAPEAHIPQYGAHNEGYDQNHFQEPDFQEPPVHFGVPEMLNEIYKRKAPEKKNIKMN